MFCPACKYEFRRGFTRCNQCDVDLVDALPPDEEAGYSAPTPAAALDHPVLLWSGASAGIFTALTTALDAAEIPYNKEELDARLVFTSQHGDLEIWVPAAHLPQAETILKSALANPLNSEAANPGNAVENDESAVASDGGELTDESGEDAGEIRDEDATRELYPEDATAEVWSGADENMAEILKSCLAEIGMACYLHRPGGDSDADSGSASFEPHGSDASSQSGADLFAVRVLPEDEARAQEVVRQVTDAAPPR